MQGGESIDVGGVDVGALVEQLDDLVLVAGKAGGEEDTAGAELDPAAVLVPGWGRRGLCPTPPSASAARRASSSPSCCVRPARTSWQILLGQTNDLLLQIILLLAAEHALCKIDRLLQVCVDFVCSAVVSLLLYRNCFIALLFAMGIGF